MFSASTNFSLQLIVLEIVVPFKVVFELVAMEKVPRIAASESTGKVRTCGISFPFVASHAFPSTRDKSSGALLELLDVVRICRPFAKSALHVGDGLFPTLFLVVHPTFRLPLVQLGFETSWVIQPIVWEFVPPMVSVHLVVDCLGISCRIREFLGQIWDGVEECLLFCILLQLAGCSYADDDTNRCIPVEVFDLMLSCPCRVVSLAEASVSKFCEPPSSGILNSQRLEVQFCCCGSSGYLPNFKLLSPFVINII